MNAPNFPAVLSALRSASAEADAMDATQEQRMDAIYKGIIHRATYDATPLGATIAHQIEPHAHLSPHDLIVIFGAIRSKLNGQSEKAIRSVCEDALLCVQDALEREAEDEAAEAHCRGRGAFA